MDKYHYSEKLNDYLLNKLSEPEKNLFEQLLDTDPVLKQDCQLQQEIVEGLHQFRKDQLKARLQRIEVSNTPNFYMPQWVKMSGIAASLLAGAVAVYVFTPMDLTQTHSENFFQASTQEQKETEPSQKTIIYQDAQKNDESLSSENQENLKLAENNPQKSTQTSELAVIPQEQAQAAQTKVEKQKPINSLQADYQGNSPAENSLRMSKMAVIQSVKKQNTASNWTAREIEEVKGVFDGSEETSLESIAQKNKLSYQYYGKEVFFYNHYDKDIKIVTLGSEGDERQYIYHDTNFYEVHPNQIEKTEASLIHDSNIIRKLKKELKIQ